MILNFHVFVIIRAYVFYKTTEKMPQIIFTFLWMEDVSSDLKNPQPIYKTPDEMKSLHWYRTSQFLDEHNVIYVVATKCQYVRVVSYLISKLLCILTVLHEDRFVLLCIQQ